MKEQWKRNISRYKVLLIAVGILLLAVISTVLGLNMTSSSSIGVYSGEDTIMKYTEPEMETETEASPELETVSPFTGIAFSVGVPVGWTKTVQDDTCTYVHRESGSAVRLQIREYDPGINNVSELIASGNIVADGKTFVAFAKTGTSSYETRYKDIGVNTYVYVEETMWDRQNIISYTAICREDYYDRMQRTFEESYGTLVWERKDPVPEDISIIYVSDRMYEYAVPADWHCAYSDGNAYAQTADGLATMTVYTYENGPVSVENMTTDEILYYIRATEKNNYVMYSYDKSPVKGYITASYTTADRQMQEKVLLNTDNTYLYVVVTDYFQGTVEDEKAEKCLQLFRAFAPVPEEETEDETDAYVDSVISGVEKAINEGYEQGYLIP